MAENNSSGPGVSRLVAVASKEFPRFSEGDVIELGDGRLLMVVTRKAGAGDFAAGQLVGAVSGDGGVSWDDELRVLLSPWDDVVDVMSVTLCRSPRGVHLFFLGRGKDAKRDTRVYQLISADEGRTWGELVRISEREGYHIVNNARVIRLKSGRMIVPAAWTSDIGKLYNQQKVHCLYSDDEGRTWKESNEVALEGKALMEPGVAECADGSVYMTIRTALGFVYEARSCDGGATWGEFGATKLTSPAAPSTVVREPGGDALWMFYINRVKGGWKDRNPLAFAASHDNGKTWSEARNIEADAKHSYGYYSVTPVGKQVLLTYYDWEDRGQPGFAMTSLRQRTIPRAWFKGEVTAPVFRKGAQPVLSEGKGRTVTCNSGLMVDGGRWRLWFNSGTTGVKGKTRAVRYAESRDEGKTWEVREGTALPAGEDHADFYHASAHQLGDRIALYVWRHGGGDDLALYRYVSADDGKSFKRDPDRALMVHPRATAALKEQAGAGRVSNDAFDVLHHENGTWEYYAACLEKAADPRAVVKHDNLAGTVRVIGRATSADGENWSEPHVVLRPDYASGDAFDVQFYGMQVFRHRGFYLGLLWVFHAGSQVIVPEWAWSHNGVNWARTGVACMALGDEGTFDSRMMIFGAVAVTAEEVVLLYGGYDWRHNEYHKGEMSAGIGRAVIPLAGLEGWLKTLPEP